MSWLSMFHSLKGEVHLSELKYPAITVCSKDSFKYALAERLGNYLDPEQDLPEKLISLRNEFMKCAIGMEYEHIDAEKQEKSCIDDNKTRRKRFSIFKPKPTTTTMLALGCKVDAWIICIYHYVEQFSSCFVKVNEPTPNFQKISQQIPTFYEFPFTSKEIYPNC